MKFLNFGDFKDFEGTLTPELEDQRLRGFNHKGTNYVM